ncbi:Crp/Fnr family transcriptional regulator [Selenihalanaerobacter shriftii]|uniref:CRP/FNR family transcriptional regulator, cyclic AMP receptor protein n=1 Tax=Selenihalanaerobacter shriftii TaxID=142842 RepID=A0A1T4KQQ2_9FIRM|nr:Crp/Fnr family transcriptional regulator [Selenihalanaerobacter shriftii]SJZ44769.1 CRP/FNR family transcriptional regulator, cyclic AMP receptor protein [Selenihalanaerobacter shriftii]
MVKMDFLSKIPLFSDLSNSELKEIEKITMFKEEEADRILFFEDDAGDAIYLILDGMVKVSKISTSGREKTLAILEKGDFFGEMSLLDGGLRSATAQVLEDVELLSIHRQDFLQVLHSYPQIGSKVIAVLSRRLRETNRQLGNAHFKSVTERIKELLIKLAKEKGEKVKDGVLIKQYLTHHELANLAGTSRESMTRTLNKLQEAGWLKIKDKDLIIVEATINNL